MYSLASPVTAPLAARARFPVTLEQPPDGHTGQVLSSLASFHACGWQGNSRGAYGDTVGVAWQGKG